jgi:hypothetical protein
MLKTRYLIGIATLTGALIPLSAYAFNSGSTGADGALNPLVNKEVELPPSGVFNYTSVNIPTGVTVKFKRNATNTPVVMLVSGDVTVAGTIDISGSDSPDTGATGNGNLADDGKPGLGGPGGYDGGAGGRPATEPGSTQSPAEGLGPGAVGMHSAGHAGQGRFENSSVGGPTYGNPDLLPLVGGSGGAGGGGGGLFAGSGGGGGGGAILIAATGTITFQPASIVNAIGGQGGAIPSVAGQGLRGGYGSGGAIRIVGTTVIAKGFLYAHNSCGCGYGRIKIEADSYTGDPTHFDGSFKIAAPSALFLANLPGIRIANVGGVNAPASPTGRKDVTLAAAVTNPVNVVINSIGVPINSIVKVSVTPIQGATATVDSTPLSGSLANAQATASVTIPNGESTITAYVTYTVLGSLDTALTRFAEGEKIDQIRVEASTSGASGTTLITETGREIYVPLAALVGWAER